MNHADNLVKLGQKGFPYRDFQSEAQIPSSTYTDAEKKFKVSACDSSSCLAKGLFFYSFDSADGFGYSSCSFTIHFHLSKG